MTAELFYTPREVATMFRLTVAALNSQRKRGLKPGNLVVKVGGKYLYPKNLIDHYLEQLANEAQQELGLDEILTSELFRTPPTNTRVVGIDEAANRLATDPKVLLAQWEDDVYPGALGWRSMPDSELVFAPREIEIWIEAHADQDREDLSSADSD